MVAESAKGRDGGGRDRDDGGGGPDSDVRSDPPDQLLDLVVQCAVQAQLAYHNEFKSEVRAKWLESFLGHEYLHVERIGGRESRIVYRGLSGLNDCSWRDYLGTMLRGSPQEYKCCYKVGTPDTAGEPGEKAQAAALAGAGNQAGQARGAVEAPWAAASASRAQNPFLNKEPAVREYTELIEPRRVAQGLVTIFRQLTNEWSMDLRMVAEEGEYLAQTCLAGDGGLETCLAACGERNSGNSSMATAVSDVRVPLPTAVYASLRGASAKWTYQADMEDAPSPFRTENFDLLQRVATREAALTALAALDADPDSAASAAWLRQKLDGEWLPRFEAPGRSQLAGVFLVELLSLQPTAKPTADDRLEFVDPVQIAYRILDERETIARDWADTLAEATPRLLQSLLAADMEETLKLDMEATRDSDESVV